MLFSAFSVLVTVERDTPAASAMELARAAPSRIS